MAMEEYKSHWPILLLSGLAGKHELVKCILFGEGSGEWQKLGIKSHGLGSLGENPDRRGQCTFSEPSQLY